MKSGDRSSDIAIIGMSALFPGAASLPEYWRNILGKVNAVSDAPDSWAVPYYDPASDENGRIYTKRGGFLGDLAEFDPLEFGIMPNAVDGGEPDQYLALKLAQEALRDAGYEQRSFDPEKAGVILGRGTYVNRGYTTLMQHGMMVDQTIDVIRGILPDIDEEAVRDIRKGLKENLPPFMPEMLPGLVPNVVTGRIANRLNLMGPNFIVDAACASSLIAVELSIRELLSGRCDMVLTGGVHASTPPQIYMIFCQLGALSKSDIAPFSSKSNGTLLGEGLGIMVLKRLRDAERDGDRIYAVIKGVGTASDGKALGLLAPRIEGEILALERAYQSSGVEPSTIGLIEAHGTGIPLGDQTEVKALTNLFGSRKGDIPGCALGTVKSMIGHCIPAAGAAGLIKSALALHHKVLPPTICEEVNPSIAIEETPFYLNTEPRPWVHGNPDIPRRAGINSFGFGGINSHAILEEYRSGADGVSSGMICTGMPSELLIIAGPSREQLLGDIDEVLAYLGKHPGVSLADMAYTLSQAATGDCRLAVVATSVKELAARLEQAAGKIRGSSAKRFQSRSGIYFSEGGETGKVAFLFSGEGGQYPNMLLDLCIYFPKVREWFDFLDETFIAERDILPSAALFPPSSSLSPAQRQILHDRLFAMDVGSEVVFTANMALYDFMTDFGIKADAMVGHSTGENAALIASGTVRVGNRQELGEKMRFLNRIYREMAQSEKIRKGVLYAVGPVSREIIDSFLDESNGKAHLAMDNCPNQAVFFVEQVDGEWASNRLRELGALCLKLPFDRAYHTPMFETVSAAFSEFYDALDVGSGHTSVYSCATADLFPTSPDAIRSLAVSQWHSRVRFRETIEKMYADGFRTFIEVGPGGNLTSFVGDILRGRECTALSCDSRSQSSLVQVQQVLARLFASGAVMDMAPLYRHRSVRTLSIKDVAGSIDSAKARKVLKREMPRLSLASSVTERIQQKISPPAASSPDENRMVAGENMGGYASPPPEIVERHFNLMQQFLETQKEFMSELLAGRVSAPVEEIAKSGCGLQGEGGGHNGWPLLGDVLQNDGSTLLAERCLDLREDLFLRDHTLGSALSSNNPGLTALPVMPFTFSMEILAQAAHCLLGGKKIVASMHNLRGYRWLALDKPELLLRIRAEVLAGAKLGDDIVPVHVRVFVREGKNGEREFIAFEGEVRLAESFSPAPSAMLPPLGEAATPRLRDEDLYTTGMFHGPQLQGVAHLHAWSKEGMEADLRTLPTDRFFRMASRPVLQTDAGLLDAAGQLVGYWLTEQYGSDFNCFPFSVGSFYQYRNPLPPGSRVACRARIRFTGARQIEASFELIDGSGRVVARLEEWQDRYFELPERLYRCRLHPAKEFFSKPWMQSETGLICRRVDALPVDVFEESWGIWKRVLAHLMLNGNERTFWYNLPEAGGRRMDWLLGRIAAKDAIRQWAEQRYGIQLAPVDVEIGTDELGKPLALCPLLDAGIPEISISHSGGHAIAVLAGPQSHVGADLQCLGSLQAENLLAASFSSEEIAVLGEVFATSAGNGNRIVGLWCAKEAASKAIGTGLKGRPGQWKITGLSDDGMSVTVVHEGQMFNVRLWYMPDEILSVCSV